MKNIPTNNSEPNDLIHARAKSVSDKIDVLIRDLKRKETEKMDGK